MALLLGVVGIYGVIAYVVSQRRREIGIRAALGAERGALQRMFVRHGLALAGLGVGGSCCNRKDGAPVGHPTCVAPR